MNRRLLPVALLALLAHTFTSISRADDLKAMEGTWTVVSAEAGGEAVESDDLKALVVTISGDHYTAKLKEEMEAGTVKLDETQKLKTMDATKTEGFEAGQVIKAVYELKDDTLRVCYAMDGGERPTELATNNSSQWLLIIYQREK
ncbi:MAG TPA: TIGR03067 domain-containing protein [Chthoniobacter sp.]|nr:TIGR03067 domain-containing protein [Chthoniobacter sp.]